MTMGWHHRPALTDEAMRSEDVFFCGYHLLGVSRTENWQEYAKVADIFVTVIWDLKISKF